MAPRSALEAVEAELRARAQRADEAGQSAECLFLEELASVADYLRRLSLTSASEHYRCEKSGALTAAAVLVQQRAFQAVTGGDVAERIVTASRLLEDARRAVTAASWGLSRGWVTPEDAERAAGVARSFRVWADQLAAVAVPDDDGEELF